MAIFGPFLASNHRTNVTVLPWQTLLPLARNVTRECVLEIGEQIALRRLVSEPDGFRMNAEWPQDRRDLVDGNRLSVPPLCPGALIL